MLSRNTVKYTRKNITIILSLLIFFTLIRTTKVYADKNYRDVTPNIERKLDEKDLLDLKKRTELKDGKLTGAGKGKNLIVIQVEALQNFVINLEYNNQEVTPNLNQLIKEKGSLYFDNYFQLNGRGNTSDAEFVSNNSLYPSMERATYKQFSDNTYYGLAWLLRDNGYKSWAFHGYKKDFWNRDKAYVNQGFERYISEEDYKVSEKIGLGITDRDFYEQSLDYIKELDKNGPFYAFMISLTSHTPFDMPEKYKKLDIKAEDKNTLLGDYLNSIHYADKELGRFIDMLKEEGLYDESVIAIYGDHFAIPAKSKAGEKLNSLMGREYDFDDMMNIPLIINIAGEDINETISSLGSSLDFYPTMMNIMGYENKKGLVFGRDLVNYKGDNLIASQTYMLKGSFISEDTMLEVSRDNMFGNSRYIDRKTRERIDVNKSIDLKEKAIEEIEKSNYILKNDYLKNYK